MRVYLFCASYWCEDCMRTHLQGKDEILLRWPNWYAGESQTVRTDEMLCEYLLANGCDPDDEATWDSDKFPKGPYENGGGEADTPQHCDQCMAFLENPLTEDGCAYVIDELRLYDRQKDDAGVDGSTFVEWRSYYGDDYYKAKPVIEWIEASPEDFDAWLAAANSDSEQIEPVMIASAFDHLRNIAESFRG